MQQTDNIIIGAGPGGYELAAMLVSKGESVTIIERDEPGGTCLNRGCIPTKCLAASAYVAEACRHSSVFGVNCGNVTVDYSEAVGRMRGIVAGLRDGVMAVLKDAVLVKGTAVLGADRTVSVDGTIYKASKRVVIATGSTPASPPIEGASIALTSDDVLTMDCLPQSAVIIGGGVIGMEFASIWSALGTDVTVVEFCKEILPPFDPEVAKRLRMAMARRGVKFMTATAVKSITRNTDGSCHITAEGKRGPLEVDAAVAVMAVGRRPVVPQGCADAGIILDARGFVMVDRHMRTSAEGIYAIGDVNGLCMLAHAATAQARVVASGNPEAFDSDRVPAVVFTMPEAAMCGPTPETLEQRGIRVRSVKRSFASNGKALAMGEGDGFVKTTYREDDGTIMSVSVIGPHAADIIAEAAILITEGVKISETGYRYIHAHPTLSEMLVTE